MNGFGKQQAIKKCMVLMFGVLTLLFLYLANIIPVLRIALYFVSSVFVFGIMLERMVLWALVMFGAVFFVGFIALPDNAGMLPYLFFFGHYGIFKYLLESSANKGTALVAKLVYFFIGFILMYFFDGGFLLSTLPFELPGWLVLVLGIGVFLVYDWLFSKGAQWYYTNARNRLLGSARGSI